MDPDRRGLLKTVGVGAGTVLAGCLGIGDDTETPTNGGDTETPTNGDETPTNGDDSETPTSGPAIIDSATHPFTIRHDPGWRDYAAGYTAIVDSEARQRVALATFGLDENRRNEISEFLDDIDYETDRLVVVESVGPNACYDRLDIKNPRIEDGRLRADATVVDTSEDDEACASVETYPSTLLRVRFDGSPVDEVAIDVTDGWGEEATVTADTDDSLSSDPPDSPGYIRPDSDPSPVAPLACDRDELTRHDQWFDEADVVWGDFEQDGKTLSLRVEETAYEYGDTVRIQLTNVSEGEVGTGNREMYNLQVYTEDGWQDVRVKEGDFGYTEEAINHPPGGGFDWTVELTETGIVEGTFHDDAEVCPDLQSGRYRFAYFGVFGEGAVAVSFDLTV